MGGTSTNAQTLAYKYLSMWFACALCNLKLGRNVLDEIYDDHNYSSGRLLAITNDSLHEAHDLLMGGKAEEGLAKVVSTLRTWPLRERVDTEIDYWRCNCVASSLKPNLVANKGAPKDPLCLICLRQLSQK